MLVGPYNKHTNKICLENAMETFERNPLKIYIQDIFRAHRTSLNKYVYELFGSKFKNIMIHGVVTSIYNVIPNSMNVELSDPTGSIQIYYNHTKNNYNVTNNCVKQLFADYADRTILGDDNIDTLWTLTDSVAQKKKKPIDFQEGSCISVVGDIFVDDLKEVRMVSAYECRLTSVERDIIWLEELNYLYEKYYIPKC